MKKIKQSITVLFIFLFSFSLVGFKRIHSQQSTASSSAQEEKKIDQLKEKIASKVAEIQNENNFGVSGYIDNIKNNLISINNDIGETYQIKTDEVITNYYQVINNRRQEIEPNEIQKGDFIIATGIIDGNQVEANNIYKDENFLIQTGQVIEINKDEYWIKVNTLEKEAVILDIETYTKKFLLNIKDYQFESVGFSKIKEGDSTIFVIKKTNNKQINRASAIKMIIIPQEFFLK